MLVASKYFDIIESNILLLVVVRLLPPSPCQSVFGLAGVLTVAFQSPHRTNMDPTIEVHHVTLCFFNSVFDKQYPRCSV